jgi:hypothetical protein
MKPIMVLSAMLMFVALGFQCDALNSTDVLNGNYTISNTTDCLFFGDINATIYYQNMTINNTEYINVTVNQSFPFLNISLNASQSYNDTDRNFTASCANQTTIINNTVFQNVSFPFLYSLLGSNQSFNDTARNLSVFCNSTVLNYTTYLNNTVYVNTTYNNTVYLDNCTQVNDTVYINNCTTVSVQNITVVNQTCTNQTIYVNRDVYVDRNATLNLSSCRNILHLNLTNATDDVCADSIETLCPLATLVNDSNGSLAGCFMYVLNPIYTQLYQTQVLLNDSNIRANDAELRYEKEKNANDMVFNELMDKLYLAVGIIMVVFLGSELWKIANSKKPANPVSRSESKEEEPLPLRINDRGE